jgi:hypothetical protein
VPALVWEQEGVRAMVFTGPYNSPTIESETGVIRRRRPKRAESSLGEALLPSSRPNTLATPDLDRPR